MKKKELIGVLMLLFTALIWGLAFVMQSKASAYVEEYTVNALRFIIAAIFLIPIIIIFDIGSERKLFSNKKIDITKKELICGAVCGVLLSGASVTQQMGIEGTGAGIAGFITSLYVVIVPVIARVFGRKTTPKNWICAIMAIGGVFLISFSGGGFSKYSIFVIVCAFLFAMHITAIDLLSPGCDGLRISFIQFVCASLITAPIMIIAERPSLDSVIACALPIVYLGIMSSGVAYTLQILGQKRTPPAVASIVMSLESVFAALGGWLIADEAMGIRQLLGCAVVFASVILTQVEIKKHNS